MTAQQQVVAIVPLLGLIAVAIATDVGYRRIPNGLSIGGAVIAVLVHATLSGSAGAVDALMGWALCFVCFLPLYAGGGMAAGDVKLMAMVGAFLGPLGGFVALLVTLVAGSALASLAMLWRRIEESRAHARAASLGTSTVSGAAGGEAPSELAPGRHALDKIPYAVAIAFGAVVAIVRPVWLEQLLPLEVLR